MSSISAFLTMKTCQNIVTLFKLRPADVVTFFAFHLILDEKIGLMASPTLEMLSPSLDTSDALKIRSKKMSRFGAPSLKNF